MNQKEEFVIKKFDMNSIPPDAVIAFIGKRRTGKSTLVKDFFYHNEKKFKAGTIISGTEKMNKYFGYFYPDVFIFDKWTPPLLKQVLDSQEKIIKHNLKKSGKKTEPIDPHSFLLMDDCFGEDSWKTDEAIKTIFFNGRHYKLCYIITMQYPLGLGPAFRSNIDYTFILRETSLQNLKRIYDNFCRANLTFDEFRAVLNQCTENFGCLVVNNNSLSSKIEDQIFWYKAESEEHPRYKNWKMGPEKLWKYNKKKAVND